MQNDLPQPAESFKESQQHQQEEAVNTQQSEEIVSDPVEEPFENAPNNTLEMEQQKEEKPEAHQQEQNVEVDEGCGYRQDENNEQKQEGEECYDKNLHDPSDHEEHQQEQYEGREQNPDVQNLEEEQFELQNNEPQNEEQQHNEEILQTLIQGGQSNFCNHIAEFYQNQLLQGQLQQEQKDQQAQESPYQHHAELYNELLEQEKIQLQKQTQSQVSHVYANQEIIEEWRDQDVQINKDHFRDEENSLKNSNYDFVGINEYQSEKIQQTTSQPEQQQEQGQIKSLSQNKQQIVQKTSLIGNEDIKLEQAYAIKENETPQNDQSKQKESKIQAPPKGGNSSDKKPSQDLKKSDIKVASAVKASEKPKSSKSKQSNISSVKNQDKNIASGQTKSHVVKKTNEANFKKEKVSQSQPPLQKPSYQAVSNVQAPVQQKQESKISQQSSQKVEEQKPKTTSKISQQKKESTIKDKQIVDQTQKNRSNIQQIQSQQTKKTASNRLLLRDKKQAEKKKQIEKQKKEAEQNQKRLKAEKEEALKQQKIKEKQELQRRQQERRQSEILQKERQKKQKQRQQAEILQKQKRQREENQRREKLRIQAQLLERQKRLDEENQRKQKQRKEAEMLQKQRIQKEENERRQKERLEAELLQQQRLQKQEKLKQQQQQALKVQQQKVEQIKQQEPPAAVSQIKVIKKKKKKKVNKPDPKDNAQNADVARPNEERVSRPQQSAIQSNHKQDDINQRSSDAAHSRRASQVNSREPSEPARPDERNIVTQIMNSESFIVGNEKEKAPLLTSLIIVKEAEKERVGTTYKMFLKYSYEYERTVATYKRIVRNVCTELEAKKQNKRPLQRMLEDYFNDFGQLCKQFNEKCYKIELQNEVVSATKNPFGNIRLQLKKGFDQMIYLRKSIANNSNRLNGYVTNTVLPQLRRAFEGYYSIISQQQLKQVQRGEQHHRREKQFYKVASHVDKNFNRGLQGKIKDDLFVEITKFINEEKLHRVALRNFGRGLIDLRHTYIRCQKQLFDRLQQIINKFKFQSRSIYCFGPRLFYDMIDYTQNIKKITRFTELCTLVDLDYIKYVLQLQSKKQTNQFTNRNFQSYLDLVFFDRVVGNIRDMLKGATNKVFPMQNEGEELVHSISGNMVLFYRPQDYCKDQYVIKNLNAKIIGSGFVEFDELLKGIIFDDSRTIRLKLRDDDRAEELICYLNQKQEDIVLGEPQP